VAFLTIPATIGLLLLGQPIIRLIFEHGRFTAADTAATTAALELYATGLVAYAAVKVIAPAFYAFDDARIPMVASVTAVAANIILNVTLHPIYGYQVLALGTALAAVCNFTMLYIMFHRRVHAIDHTAILRYLARIAVCAGLMGAAVWGTLEGTTGLGIGGLAGDALSALGPVTVGIAVYVAMAKLMGIEELGHLLGRFAGRRGS
jgi:putative peptidoglycan lipid II flippase